MTTWFDVWNHYQLECIYKVANALCNYNGTAPHAPLYGLKQLHGLCNRYNRDLLEFRTLPRADVERLCHDDMVHHWQLLRIAFLPELNKLIA